MLVEKRYVFIFVLLYVYFVASSIQDTSPASRRRKRHIFPLLGYLQGYKIGQNFALQYPPYVLPQIIILPTVNQQQAINLQKSYTDENYQESGGIFQNIQSGKLTLNRTYEKYSLKETKNPCESIESDSEDVVRQVDAVDESKDQHIEISYNEKNMSTNTSKSNEFTPITGSVKKYVSTTTVATNFDLQITKNVPAIATNLTLPNIKQNLNFSNNNMINSSLDIEKPTNIPVTNESISSNLESSTYPSYTYQNARYHNSLVDEIRLTTNPYSAEYMSYNDRWDVYSDASKNSLSGFRPLAGLYYDGFLVKPVSKRSSFIPVKSYSGRK